MNSILPTSFSQLSRDFDLLAKHMKEKGECRLSGNSLLDRYSVVKGFKNKKALKASTTNSDTSTSSSITTPISVWDGKISKKSIETLDQLVFSDLLPQMIKIINHELYEDKKFYPCILDIVTDADSVVEGVGNITSDFVKDVYEVVENSDNTGIAVEWAFEENLNGHERSEYLIDSKLSFKSNIDAFDISRACYELSDAGWSITRDDLNGLPYDDGYTTWDVLEMSQRFRSGLLSMCLSEMYSPCLKAVLTIITRNWDSEERDLHVSERDLNLAVSSEVWNFFTKRSNKE